jgi:hypothetical protein
MTPMNLNDNTNSNKKNSVLSSEIYNALNRQSNGNNINSNTSYNNNKEYNIFDERKNFKTYYNNNQKKNYRNWQKNSISGNNNNKDFYETPINLNYNNNFNFNRQSKLSNFNNDLLFSSSKKMSFLSYGEEFNSIGELNKNSKNIIPDQSRKSSLNFFGMLRSQDFSKYRNSDFSIENDLGILKEYENNNEKSTTINFTYEINDIISVYFHMNYLKLFEYPQEFKECNFIEGIMTKEVKGNIEKFKEKKLIIRNKAKSLLLKSVKQRPRSNFRLI